MVPKKEKGKSEGDRVVIFSEVEKTFLEQQVTECNRKISRLRSVAQEHETRNEELQNAYKKLDEDRADVIAYLKKQFNAKNDEYNELKEKFNDLTELKEIENLQFHETVTKLEKNFTAMKDQLTSENKLLTGKLNTLEEFRVIKDNLMQKFEKQEQKYEDQEMKYKRIIYNAEKMFVIGKDKLKQEMETRLLQLAQDFQDATEHRIAASTHRVIRENIAINNELDNILTTQQKVSVQTEKYREKIRNATIAKELAEGERDTAINKSIVQLKVIDQLTAAFENIKKDKRLFDKRSYDFEVLQAKIDKLTKENNNLILQVRILEQNLHAKLCDQNKVIADASKASKERNKLLEILKDAAFSIKAALKLDQWAHVDPGRQAMDRKLFLSRLLQIVSQFREIQGSESLATIASFSKVYDKGDLGFVPKSSTNNISGQSSVCAVQQIQKQQQESMRGELRESGATTSLSTCSLSSSIATIPSIQVLPKTSTTEVPEAKTSYGSFIISTQSTDSVEQESEHEEDSKTELEKQLLASKLEIQKTILKDLAFSQVVFKKSTQSLLQKPSEVFVLGKISSTFSHRKSVTIMDSIQSVDDSNISEDCLISSSSLERKDMDVDTEKKVPHGTDLKTINSLESKTDEEK